jgi:hypothetical protein
MPGTFHVEVVPSRDGQTFEIFLLDIAIKNPTTRNSSVTAKIAGKAGATPLVCAPIRDRFVCRVAGQKGRSTSAAAGSKLIVTARRDGVLGKITEYPLPLSFADLKR